MSKKTLALSHIDNYINGGKNTILLLENKFFYIFKIQIENVLNEEDRKEKLEDRLEIVFPRYNSDDFVLRYEILKKDRKKENIVVYLLDLALLNDYIIDDMNRIRRIDSLGIACQTTKYTSNCCINQKV